MMLTLRRAATGIAVAALASSAALTAGGAAHATTPPPWETDPNSVGGLVFYNAAGGVVTGGSTTASPIAAYVEGTSAIRAGDTKATLYGYLPVLGQDPGQWQGEAMSASTTYPHPGAPSAVSKTLPVVTGSDSDESVATLALDFPNNDKSTDGYAGVYVLRVRTTAPSEPANTTYDSAAIKITGSTWAVIYTKSPTISTTTTLTATPATASVGSPVTLTATLTPAAATGAVSFYSGTTLLKEVGVTAGKAVLTTTALKLGTDQLTAKFVPTGSTYLASTSAIKSVTITAVPTKTTLKASAKKIKKGKKLTLTVKETPAVPGKAAIYNGAKKIGTVTVKKGKAKFATRKLKVGSHKLKAKFTPSSANDAKSTSKVIKVKVTK